MTVEQQIRERAFYLWEQDGGQTGRADHYWFAAEREIQAMNLPAAPKKRAPAKKPKANTAAVPQSRNPATEIRA
jgi:hypothetical protein